MPAFAGMTVRGAAIPERPSHIAGLPWWHPAALIATGLGSGLLPIGPGTWGSLAALIAGWFIVAHAGYAALAAAAIIAFAIGCWASGRVARASGAHDPGFIVIDEIAAQWLVLLAVPLDRRWYAAAFLLFRLFDIAKPWPIRVIERRVAGGLGVMLDDVMAALYAVLLLLIAEGALGVRP
jgi:phosphatidylglycerophosphatase A